MAPPCIITMLLAAVDQLGIAERRRDPLQHVWCIWTRLSCHDHGDNSAILPGAGTGFGECCANNERGYLRGVGQNGECILADNMQSNRFNRAMGVLHAIACRQTSLVSIEE